MSRLLLSPSFQRHFPSSPPWHCLRTTVLLLSLTVLACQDFGRVCPDSGPHTRCQSGVGAQGLGPWPRSMEEASGLAALGPLWPVAAVNQFGEIRDVPVARRKMDSTVFFLASVALKPQYVFGSGIQIWSFPFSVFPLSEFWALWLCVQQRVQTHRQVYPMDTSVFRLCRRNFFNLTCLLTFFKNQEHSHRSPHYPLHWKHQEIWQHWVCLPAEQSAKASTPLGSGRDHLSPDHPGAHWPASHSPPPSLVLRVCQSSSTGSSHSFSSLILSCFLNPPTKPLYLVTPPVPWVSRIRCVLTFSQGGIIYPLCLVSSSGPSATNLLADLRRCTGVLQSHSSLPLAAFTFPWNHWRKRLFASLDRELFQGVGFHFICLFSRSCHVGIK